MGRRAQTPAQRIARAQIVAREIKSKTLSNSPVLRRKQAKSSSSFKKVLSSAQAQANAELKRTIAVNAPKLAKPSLKNFASRPVTTSTSTTILSSKKTSNNSPTIKIKKPASVFNTAKNKGSSKLSAATIARQQQLSNDFGIATFSRSGKISTVPTISSGGFSDINTGIGSFSSFDAFANAAIGKQVSQDTSGSDVVTVSDPRNPSRSGETQSDSFLGKAEAFFEENKTMVLIGGGILALMLLGGKR